MSVESHCFFLWKKSKKNLRVTRIYIIHLWKTYVQRDTGLRHQPGWFLRAPQKFCKTWSIFLPVWQRRLDANISSLVFLLLLLVLPVSQEVCCALRPLFWLISLPSLYSSLVYFISMVKVTGFFYNQAVFNWHPLAHGHCLPESWQAMALMQWVQWLHLKNGIL